MPDFKIIQIQSDPKIKEDPEVAVALFPSASAAVWAPVSHGRPGHWTGVFSRYTALTLQPLAHPDCPISAWIQEWVCPPTGGLHLPVYSVFISLESVVNRGAHTGRHGVGVGGVRVLVGVQLGPVVEVHRLHGPGAVRVSVHGGRNAHPVHPVVGQVFVLHTQWIYMHKNMSNSGYNFAVKLYNSGIYYKSYLK